METSPITEDGFRRTFDAHVEAVWRFLVRLGASPADAEDLAQEVFVIVHRRIDQLDAARSVRPWLFGIARNVLRDHRRLARHRKETLDPEIDEARSDPAVRAFESAGVVRAALLDLPEPLRALIVLHDLEEMEMREAAEVLDVALDTAYARLRRARVLLREAIERRGNP